MEYPETDGGVGKTSVPQVRNPALDAKPGSRTSSKQVHRVLGDEAARPRTWHNLDGVVVDVEITDWPSPTQNPRGKVVEILGNEDDFGVDVEIMIRKHHLPHRFPPEVLDEAQAIENVIPTRELRQRRDYRGLPIVTIDGETARDFDDAVTVRQLDNGNYELQVHIADVAQYVTGLEPARPGSPPARYQRLLPRPRRPDAAPRTLHRSLQSAPEGGPAGSLLRHGNRSPAEKYSATKSTKA